ncbi:uncharacterized protein MYCGRDRAFT_106618 [Zymoseptoria tritici IPO323]|uniref:Uncharacterized protein n=1 Tax=Zymoseptoria tritici (strain CBS 115943 / IPO323) TaxID=336722 RepID=F9XQY6_ZYMTI|nr:uncharacterized protein MYCGRDRAFT_106618 [Zymoseptoria tritici IPO323]EGP82340.1 hypothetical protein MYCGRDRAFT_106618 [Zymoseptoria tritici IPO323]
MASIPLPMSAARPATSRHSSTSRQTSTEITAGGTSTPAKGLANSSGLNEQDVPTYPVFRSPKSLEEDLHSSPSASRVSTRLVTASRSADGDSP